jgi:hypothetical protein
MTNFLKHHTDKTILMKVTSRDRHEVLMQTVNTYLKLSLNPDKMIWLFSLDTDDLNTIDAVKGLKIENKRIFIGDSENKIHAINRDVEFVDGWDILLNISDDQLPVVNGYDDIIRKTMPNDLDASLWFSDGWQPRINTQEIVGREYYNRFGYVYNPLYKSFFCDNESTEIAEILGKSIKVNKCIIKHFHPGWDSNSHIKRDALYVKNDAHWQHDEELFKHRQSINFK